LGKNLTGKLRLRDRIETIGIRQLLENYKEALDNIRADLGKIYERYAEEGVLTHAQMSKYNRLTALEKQLTEDIRPVFSRNRRLINKLAQIQYEASFYHTAWAIDQNVGVQLNWGVLNTDAVAAAVGVTDDYALASSLTTRELAAYNHKLHYQALRGIREDGLRKLQRTLTQGLIRGLSYEKMAREVKGALNDNANQAIRVIRTEGTKSQAMGQLRSYDQAEKLGVEVRRIWDATLDSNTRPRHARLDGKEANEDGLFETAVGLIRGPGLSGVASFDINCRCRVSARVDDVAPKIRRTREDGVVPYQTFEEWAQGKGLKRSKYGQEYKF
jgi:SPP1 gp7 family putative phage head morphogenesis protein